MSANWRQPQAFGAFAVLSAALFGTTPAAAGQQWVAVGSLDFGRYDASMLTLPDERVLVLGGHRYPDLPTGEHGAEIFDPSTLAWSKAAFMPLSGNGQAASLLDDGTVIATAGCGLYGFANPAARRYVPETDTWSTLHDMNFTHAGGTLITLQSGRVLMAGGSDCNGYPEGNAELYDPSTDEWSPAGHLWAVRDNGLRLKDGKVLMIGGGGFELYDPVTNEWTHGPDMFMPRNGATLLLLPDGKVLALGGRDIPPRYVPHQVLALVELYDPATNEFSVIAPMPHARGEPTATLLGDGRVLVAGGGNGEYFAGSAAVDIYDPQTGKWQEGPPLLEARSGHSSALLPNGKLLVTAGVHEPDGHGILAPRATSEVYSPACGIDVDCMGGDCVDGFCCDSACDGGCEACSSTKKGFGAEGTCQNVMLGRDPDEECQDSRPASCGTSGACDGKGSCSVYAAGSVCASARCEGDQLRQGGVCSGLGVCAPGLVVSCGNYLCQSGACPTSCSAETACVDGAYCDGQHCRPWRGNGDVCDQAEACKSGNCIAGVCCDTPCDETCQACSIAGGAEQDGVCGPATGAACDDHDACTLGDECADGLCVATTPKICVALDACHQPGACDAATGECSQLTAPDETACDDADPCTVGEFCRAGSCMGGQPRDCGQDALGGPLTCDPFDGACKSTNQGGGAQGGTTGEAGAATAGTAAAGGNTAGTAAAGGSMSNDTGGGGIASAQVGGTAAERATSAVSSGCSCRLAPRARDARGWLALALAGAWLTRRRRWGHAAKLEASPLRRASCQAARATQPF